MPSAIGAVGLLYIMFLAGLEIDLGVVKTHKMESATVGVLAFALTLVLVVGAGLFMDYGWSGAILLGAALSSHTLISYPLIERLHLLSHRPIVATVGGTLLTDTLALILLVIVIQRAESGNRNMLEWIGPLLLLVVLVVVALFGIPYLGRWFFKHVGEDQAEKALFVLGILMVLAVAAELIDTEMILGAFLAGVCLNTIVKPKEMLAEHIQFVGRMLFIPFFFIETGMQMDLDVFTGEIQTWLLAALLLGGVLVGKAVAVLLAGHMLSYDRLSQALMFGLTIPQAAATLAVVVTGHEAGLLDMHIVDAVIIVIFLTCTIGPLVARFASTRLTDQVRQEQESPNDE